MLAATAERAPGEAFILSGPEPVTWNAFYGAFSAMLGVDSTVSVSPEQALQQWKESARRPWLVPEWLRSVRQDAVLRDRLLSTHEGNLVRRAAFKVLPDAYFAPERWQPPAADDADEPALATFRPDVIARLSSRAVASARKARELLGYEPLFDLGAGMRLTEAWASAEGLLRLRTRERGDGRDASRARLGAGAPRARPDPRRAARRFVVHDVVEVTWRPERFRRSLSRLYGTDLPVDSGKERESGTGPFVVAVVDDQRPHTVARRTQHGWEQANAALLAAKRRYRGWAGGSYRVHTTLSPVETTRDAMLILGEPLDTLRARTWDSGMRAYERDLLGDPAWDDLGQLQAGLSATMRCAFPSTEADGPVEVVTDDAWWAIRIVDPPTAEGRDEPEVRLRRPVVGGQRAPRAGARRRGPRRRPGLGRPPPRSRGARAPEPPRPARDRGAPPELAREPAGREPRHLHGEGPRALHDGGHAREQEPVVLGCDDRPSTREPGHEAVRLGRMRDWLVRATVRVGDRREGRPTADSSSLRPSSNAAARHGSSSGGIRS